MASLETIKTKSGTAYRITWYENGVRHRNYLGIVSKTVAEKELVKTKKLEKIKKYSTGTERLSKEAGIITALSLKEFYAVYKSNREPEIEKEIVSQAQVSRVLYSVQLLIDIVGNKLLTNLTKADLEEFKKMRLSAISPEGTNKDLANLKTALRYCYQNEYIATPFYDRVEAYKVIEKLPPYLTPAEVDEVELFVYPDLSTFAYKIFKFTGIRRGAMVRIRWKDIIEDYKYFHLKKTKTKAERKVPIHDKLKVILMERRKQIRPKSTDLLVPYHPDTITRHFSRAMKDAGIEKDRIAVHVLRHSLGFYLGSIGTPLHIIAQILGHKTLYMAKKYSQIADVQGFETVNKLY